MLESSATSPSWRWLISTGTSSSRFTSREPTPWLRPLGPTWRTRDTEESSSLLPTLEYMETSDRPTTQPVGYSPFLFSIPIFLAKAALIGFSNSLAQEGAKYNILSNALVPTAGSRLTQTVMPQELVDALKPEFVTPLVINMVHDSFQETGRVFEAGAGWYGQRKLSSLPIYFQFFQSNGTAPTERLSPMPPLNRSTRTGTPSRICPTLTTSEAWGTDLPILWELSRKPRPLLLPPRLLLDPLLEEILVTSHPM